MYESLPNFVREPNPGLYLSDNYIVFDFETSNHEHGTALNGQNQLILAAWSLGNSHPRFSGTVRTCWGGEFDQSELAGDIASAAFIVCHNTKFELGWLRRCGVDLRKVLCYDTMIGEKVLAGNRKFPLSLDATAARRGLGHKETFVSTLIKAGVCPSEIPQSALRQYCEQDVALTEQIFLLQRAELKEMGLLPVAYCRNLVTPVLADIEFAGMKLDKERVEKTHGEYSKKYASVAAELSKLTGGINPKSSKQMRQFIYGSPSGGVDDEGTAIAPGLGFAELVDARGDAQRTDGGEAKVDKNTLLQLSATTAEQKRFKECALKLAALKVPVQNLKKMQGICEATPNDPRVFATFNQTVTATHRLSSSGRGKGGFNFQNFDRAFKPLFQARDASRVICEGDAGQLEFRVAAYLGNDANAKDDIQKGVDVHAVTAATIGCDRQTAKAFTFKPLFGGGSGTKREKRYFAYFKQRYSGVARVQDRWAMEAASTKRTVMPWGLIFYWPDSEIQQSGYVTGQTQIYNAPIQSFATADIIPLCLVLLWHSVAGMGDDVTIINTIHDSIIADVDIDALEEYTARLARAFTSDIYTMLERLYGIKFDVPLSAGVKSAFHWGEGKEIKFEATQCN